MGESIVVYLGIPSERLHENVGQRVTWGRELVQRAATLGATVCAWGPDGVGLRFDAPDLEEAITLVTARETRPAVQTCSVGIAQGSWEQMTSDDNTVSLGWGQALVLAFQMSRLAEVGEVVIESETLSSHDLQLTTRGVRTTPDNRKVLGHVLATTTPFKAQSTRPLEHLVEPQLVGRDAELNEMFVEAGTLAILRAGAGLGGTRFLRELASLDDNTHLLFLTPVGQGAEPLGSLRRAFSRAVARGVAPELPPAHTDALDALLAGRGIPLPVASTLLECWLTPKDPKRSGLLLLDDTSRIDSPTLEVIANALLSARQPFRAIARLGDGHSLPFELAPLPPGPEVELKALSVEQAAKLAEAWSRGTLPNGSLEIWIRRGGGNPLAISEAIADAISSGEWARAAERPKTRSMTPPPATPQPSSVWIERRFSALAPSAKSVLTGLAILGGEAPASLLTRVLDACADVPTTLAIEQQKLRASGWLVEPEPNWLSLPTRTHQNIIEGLIPDTRRSVWHRSASIAIEESQMRLARAESAWHALKAEDLERAQRLAKEAAAAAQEAGLDDAARSLGDMPQRTATSASLSQMPDPLHHAALLGILGIPDDMLPPSSLILHPSDRPNQFTFALGEDNDPTPLPSLVQEQDLAFDLADFGGDSNQTPFVTAPVHSSFPPEPAPHSNDSHPPFGDSDRPTQRIMLDELELNAGQLGTLKSNTALSPYPPELGPPVPGKRPSPVPPKAPTSSQPPSLRAPRVPSTFAPVSAVKPPPLSIASLDDDEEEDAEPTNVRAAPAVDAKSPLSDSLPAGRSARPSEPNTLQTKAHEKSDGLWRDSDPPTLEGIEPDTDEPRESTLEELITLQGHERLLSEPPSLNETTDQDRSLPALGREALLRNNPEAFNAWTAVLQATGNRTRLIERVQALRDLNQADPTPALRVLRLASEQSSQLDPLERSRSQLAFAVGLARTGQVMEALVQSLEALARAREARDDNATRACAVFLQQLSLTAGHKEEAKSWERYALSCDHR